MNEVKEDDSCSIHDPSYSDGHASNAVEKSPDRNHKISASHSTENDVGIEKRRRVRGTDDNLNVLARPDSLKGRKRAGSELHRSASRVQRMKNLYNDGYRKLLNEESQRIVSDVKEDDIASLSTSQNGSSIWTSEEKIILFAALARLGSNNRHSIALQVGSKTEPEVSEYLYLLQHSLSDDKRMKRYNVRNPFGPVDVPAAAEISEQCCIALEEAADELAIRQKRYEELIEKSKWGESWLLTRATSNALSVQCKKDDGKALDEVLPSASFFELKNWINLSESIFMNFSDDDDNWQGLAGERETPAIRATALEDFYSLTISITKRLVSTVLFIAMSRLRAMGSNKTRRAVIIADDVDTAMVILGLASNANEYWVRCARRCKLKVLDEGQILSYDEVEKLLRDSQHSSNHSRHDNSRIRHSPGSTKRQRPPQDSLLVDEDVTDDSGESSSVDVSGSEARGDDIDRLELTKEEYTEAFDAKSGTKEERRLWEMLGRSPPPKLEAERVGPLPRPRNGGSELGRGDWRDWVSYRAEWEVCERPIEDQKHIENRR